jgi:hypothetical protein
MYLATISVIVRLLYAGLPGDAEHMHGSRPHNMPLRTRLALAQNWAPAHVSELKFSLLVIKLLVVCASIALVYACIVSMVVGFCRCNKCEAEATRADGVLIPPLERPVKITQRQSKRHVNDYGSTMRDEGGQAWVQDTRESAEDGRKRQREDDTG